MTKRIAYTMTFVLLVLAPLPVKASVVISEVMWPGTDLSSSDEWVEIGATTDTDLSGGRLTYINSKGEEVMMASLGSGFLVSGGEYFLVAHYHAENSRLAAEPRIVSSQVTLPNTKLILRIRGADGAMLDEVNAGTSSPFAGLNPTGGMGRASMERIDLLSSGSDPKNWVTAIRSLGFDEGSADFGTPGFSYQSDSPSSSLSSFSSFSSSSSSSCIDHSLFGINIQSGSPEGVGRVTINMQVIALSGSFTHATCIWDFGDGNASTSCNPPSHTYDNIGTFTARVTVTDACGSQASFSQSIVVHSDPSSVVVPSASQDPLAHIVIRALMPNAPGADALSEWVELKNLEERSVPLVGFTFNVDGKQNPIVGVSSIAPFAVLRLYRSESKLELPNADGSLELKSPLGVVLSSVTWEDATEGQIIKPSSFRSTELSGIVSRVIDGDTVEVALDDRSRILLPEDAVTVRLLGIDTPELDPLQPYAMEAKSFVDSMLLGQPVTLSFDVDCWDKFGRLLAYITLPDGRSAEREILSRGLAEAIHVFPYTRKDEYLALEAEAQEAKLKLWSGTGAEARSQLSKLRSESGSVTRSMTSSGLCIFQFSEVYPSPLSAAKTGSLLGREWIELRNTNESQIVLSGATLIVGKRKAVLHGIPPISSKGLSVVDLTSLSLHLPNDGGSVGLRTVDGCSASLTYPKVRPGSSIIVDERGVQCISALPSPGTDASCSSSSGVSGKTRRVRKSVYDTYARNYVADAKSTSLLSPLALVTQSSPKELIAVAILAAMGGGAGVLLAMRLYAKKNGRA